MYYSYFQRVIGSDCSVLEPLYNTRFSLSSLHASNNNYEVESNGVKFDLNICGALNSPADECKDAGGCQALQDGRHFSMGMISISLYETFLYFLRDKHRFQSCLSA